MTETAITITAVIPAYNAAEYIARAIKSVLAQTRPADEIIVVDDGSTDNTLDVVRSFGEKVILIQQENGGASAARNTGINAATGNWIAFLDADDEWLPNMLELQTNILRQHPDIAWTGGNYKICFCKRKYGLIKNEPERIQALLKNKLYFDDFFDAFIHKTYGCMDCMVIRKDVFQKVGLYSTTLPRANDIDMWFRIAYRYPKIGFVDQPLAIYHFETGDSLASYHMDYAYLRRFLQRHLDMAKEADRLEPFTLCAKMMLRAWIRSAFFDDRIFDVRKAMRQFDFLLSKRYKCLIYVMTILPGLIKHLFQILSWLSRTFKLRRQTWHPKEKHKRR